MHVADAQLAFPFIVLAIAVVAVARLARGDALVVKQREFVTAARAIGVGEWRIAVRHVLPHIVSPISVVATFHERPVDVSM